MAHLTNSLPEEDVLEQLELRMGAVHARQRLGIERDHEDVFGHGINFFHPENWYSTHSIFRTLLKATGLYGRGHENTKKIQIRHNDIQLGGLPAIFDGFTVLHISDMHADMNDGPMRRLSDLLPDLQYDICVLTGDFRGQTFGPFDASLRSVAEVRRSLRGTILGVLGNHDSIRMIPDLEAMGIRMLLNETEVVTDGEHRLYFAGVDDAHYYRVDNIHKAAAAIPADGLSILLSHTPEIYRQAAHAGFNIMLSGHTHGGQICLPGSVPLTLDSVLPRHMGAGRWEYAGMAGYTSVGVGSSIVPVRFNCPPEITLHHLRRAPSAA